jgi:hypothetical protein
VDPQGLWLAGFVFFAASVFLLLLRVVVALLLERNYETAERYGGPVSLEEEVTSGAATVATTSQGRD